MAAQKTYPRIEGPKKEPDGTYVVLVYRTADDLERIVVEDLEAAQTTIGVLQRAKKVFTPSKEAVLARVRGRNPKLTPRVHKAIVERIKGGATNLVAAQASGICEKTFYNWLENGRNATNEKDIYFQFLQDVEVAGAEHECSLVDRLTKSADYDWRPALALLQHHQRYRGRWGKQVGEYGGEGVTVVFHRPEMDPDVESDDLISVTNADIDSANGSNGKHLAVDGGNGDARDR
jgi:hypothetical protein